MKNYLGIDWGEKRIGLAMADSETKIAIPFKVVGSVNDVALTVKDEKIDIIVIGKPLKMRDEKHKIQNEFLVFLNQIKKKIKIPIQTIDERLSSKAANVLLNARNKQKNTKRIEKNNKKIKAPIDAVAAMLILQSYMDSHNVERITGRK